MSGLFGRKSSAVSSNNPVVSGLRVTTALSGKAVPIVYGKTRLSPNVVEYVDFESIPHSSSSSSGGKGGGSSNNGSTTYTYQAAVELAICQGPVNVIPTVWQDKSQFLGSSSANVSVMAKQAAIVNYNGSATGIQVANASVFLTDLGVIVTGAGIAGGAGDTGTDNTWQSYTLIPGTDYTESAGTYSLSSAFCAAWAGCAIEITYTYQASTAIGDALSQANLGLIQGFIGQAPWSYMSSAHAGLALGYSGIALAVGSTYQLDSSGTIPNISFEVDTPWGFNATVRDANPKDVLYDLLTNPYYGANYPSARVGDLTNWSQYCVASYFFLSPAYTDQKPLQDLITQLMKLTNSDCFFSEKKLKVVPYGDQPLTGTYGTWTPNLTAVYALTDDSYLPFGGGGMDSLSGGDGDGSDAPVQMTRKSPQDRYNSLSVKIYDRQLAYNETPIQCTDAALIDKYGLNPMQDLDAYEICDVNVARQAGQTILQRQAYVCNTYQFTLPFSYALLEPMDLVTLTDSGLGLVSQLVRITSIVEDNAFNLQVTADEVLAGHASAVLYAANSSTGYNVNYNVTPQSVTYPIFFEPPVALAGSTGLAVWCAVNGQLNDPNWGGCDVWVSSDGTNYRKQATLSSGSRYGFTNATTTNTDVNFAGLGAVEQFLPGTATDAANKATLCWLGNGSPGGEFFSYQGATLTGPYAYDLGGCVRGQYDTPIVNVASGSPVVRCDNNVVKGPALDLSQIGTTIYFKFTSFNIYGGGEQQLSAVPAYTYTVTGAQTQLPPSNVASIAESPENFGVQFTWPLVSDPDIAYYRLRVGAAGTTWAAGTPLVGSSTEGTHISGDNFFWGPQLAGTYKVMVKAVSTFGVESTTEASCTFSVAVPAPTGAVGSFVGANYLLQWTAAEGNFQIAGFNVYTGASFGSAIKLASNVQSSQFTAPAQWVGTRKFFITALDAAGNEGSPVEIDLNVVAPSQPLAFVANNVDNNLLFYWQPPSGGTLPLASFTLTKGSTYAGSTQIGKVSGNATFDSYFELSSGNFTYWLTATDTAGNVSTAQASINLNVAAPPNFILQADVHSTFSGTLTNMYVSNGQLYGPVNTTETMPGHGTNNSWTNPAAQVAASEPLYFQPNATSGSYEEVYDYGATIASTLISATYTTGSLGQGTVTVTPKISVSNSSATGPWTDYPGASQVYASNFRWVKIHYDFAAAAGGNLIDITGIEYKLSLKSKSDNGSANAVSTDSGGTVVDFNISFIDVTSIVVTPVSSGSTPITAVVNFTSTSYPLQFQVLLFNSLTGARVSGPFNWQASGV